MLVGGAALDRAALQRRVGRREGLAGSARRRFSRQRVVEPGHEPGRDHDRADALSMRLECTEWPRTVRKPGHRALVAGDHLHADGSPTITADGVGTSAPSPPP